MLCRSHIENLSLVCSTSQDGYWICNYLSLCLPDPFRFDYFYPDGAIPSSESDEEELISNSNMGEGLESADYSNGVSVDYLGYSFNNGEQEDLVDWGDRDNLDSEFVGDEGT